MALTAPFQSKLKDGRTLVIRNAVETEAAVFQRVLADYLNNGAGQLWEPGEFNPTVDDEKKWIVGLNTDPKAILLIAEVDGEIVGNIDFQCGPRKRISHTGELGMGVLPAWRGKGIGEALLSALIDWARAQPAIEKINLRVISNNSAGIALYRKLGFTEEGRRVREVKYSDGTYADDISMGLLIKSTEG